MFRSITTRLGSAVSTVLRTNTPQRTLAASVRQMSHGQEETDEQFDARYIAYFNRPEIDGWELRKGINDLQAYDVVPEPKIMDSVLRACRRLDDYALAIRYMEAVKEKCGNKVSTIWPYLEGQIQPTLDELGISSLSEMGYDKPEYFYESVYDMHG